MLHGVRRNKLLEIGSKHQTTLLQSFHLTWATKSASTHWDFDACQ